jgi:hypothetical protein
VGDDRQRPRVYDEPPSGIVLTTRGSSRTLGFRISDEPTTGRLAGEGLLDRVGLEPSAHGFRARLARDHEHLPCIGASLLLEIEVALEGGGAASLHLPVTLREIHGSGLVTFLDLYVDGGVIESASEAETRPFEQASAR